MEQNKINQEGQPTTPASGVPLDRIVSLEDLRTHDDFFVAIKEASSIEELTRLAKEYDDGVGIILERKKFLEDEIDRMYKEKEQLDRDYPFYGDIKGSITFEIGRLILES